MYFKLMVSKLTVASSPGHTHFSMLHACNIEKWVWPGDEAKLTVLYCGLDIAPRQIIIGKNKLY